ncbi:DUF3221 domain-containing protein [Halobacillus locisalis]|uniref:DUF3221 domain-containing protein n=1 Tax=Halobacillus locisalis TaxID=220753 RepID=A0A838CNX6_9BACI|nr:DUF3221 domain-containing protein [Halobacillus locisalis]MBA2173767.1 DUF3221 domain-containing protein [Halobacillus locisalis]
MELDSYNMLIDSCPEVPVEGITRTDLTEEELKKYPTEVPDIIKDYSTEEEIEKYKNVQVLIRTHREFLMSELESRGYSFEDLQSVGEYSVVQGTTVIGLKQGLSSEQEKIKTAILESIEVGREHFSPGAYATTSLTYSRDELDTKQFKLASELSNEISKISGVGSCNLADAFELRVWKTLTEDELEWVNNQTEMKLAITLSEPSELTGYVTDLKEDDKMLVDHTWFSNRPESVEVGDRVHLLYTSVAESFPAQSHAKEPEILKDVKPDGAELHASEAIKQSLSTVDSSEPLNVLHADYDQESDEWTIELEIGMETTEEVEVTDAK